ncbi:ABC transporter permease subunit [Paenibacillus albiflavus]|uniref:ABC transporter permease subunit n=1 Tax=Paenibacillus albiflavus TaxID=2545760 RepID=A0A4R4EFP0_9BACL|nr:ABC transporter permease subunit [Paenibacillus albiflavus]TCZ78886.1 ABC transporter permease subunit [Paenibacillus albiflavus]
MTKKWIYILSALSAIIIIFLLGNLHKGIIIEPTERLQLELSVITPITLEEIQQHLPSIEIENHAKNEIRVPIGEMAQTIQFLKVIPGVLDIKPLSGMPSFSFKQYGIGLIEQINKLMKGDMGTVYGKPGHKEYALADKIPQMMQISFSYLIPGLLLGIVFGFLFAILASLYKKLGYGIDLIHKLLMLLPDFVIIVLLQLMVIFITRFTDGRFLLIAQVGTEVPFVIPLLTVMCMPSVLIYGAIRSAIMREEQDPYITTAYSKGLTRKQVLFRHILRNVMEDLFAVLPRATTAAVTSMIIVEMICLILGVGGYALSKYFASIDTMSTICLILAVFTILMHLIFAWLRTKLVIHTGEAVKHE